MLVKKTNKNSYSRNWCFQGDRGIVSIEFALMFPIFLLLLFAAYELGIYLHDKQVLTNATREAARLGVIMQNPRPTADEIRTKVADWSDTLIGIDDLESSADCIDQPEPEEGEDPEPEESISIIGAQGNSGDNLIVSVCTPYSFPLLSSFSDFFEVPLTSRSVMVLE